MSKPTTIIGRCPNDGREWDNQCARCGSSIHFVECDCCGGDGVSSHDCGEDTCCCADPDDNVTCDWCRGTGGFWECLSSQDWCATHAREGREHLASGTPEWFTFERPRRLTRMERLQAAADAGVDTWEDYRGEK